MINNCPLIRAFYRYIIIIIIIVLSKIMIKIKIMKQERAISSLNF